MFDEMKIYRNGQYNFEIDVPKEWLPPKRGAIKTPFGASIVFDCGTNEDFNFQIGWLIPEALDQTEHEFRRHAQENRYSQLELGRIAVGGREHVWARYQIESRDWKKKYLLVFGETEYAITATCYDRQLFGQKERTWDTIVASFRLIPFSESRTTNSMIERMNQAAKFSERGFSYFRSGHYHEALEQFEKGRMVTHEVTWNFLGASMTVMQMLEMDLIPEDQITLAVDAAKKNIRACMLIAPNEPDYVAVLKGIEDFVRRHNI